MEYVEARRERVEERLAEVVARVDPAELSDQLADAVLAGGKRVRPTLTLLVCEAMGGDPADALDFGVGIELVHNASLVVDDIIDRSELRRGEASAWAAAGYGPALIASDGLLGEAFALFDDPRAMSAVADAMVELGEGEAMELVDRPETEDEYMTLARRKTGALFRAAAELGAIAADADETAVETVGEYAEHVGVAFQIRDDVLDATADTAALGKPAGQDEVLERPSVVRVTDRPVEDVNELADAESAQARAALESLDLVDGDARTYLEELAGFVVERER
ncbi:polyprenyl synthetase family protein [Salarchaeum sp. JOR-1]|uniref:polyprenyl synthetase family protein n=1 Tax=Salarchaeum sp. JOR-1 TaxID=2599399 RepID=UPI0011986791|nr:polyprenyl synthetase family protein [Salarchaeum sp. JOR-1]QDX40363.1 polyprenyl synthetase family protein [Salarchaeum sp. JOR-1]